MLASLLAISWEPGLRGVIVVITMVIVLIGGSYLIVGTNLGARLGVLVVLAALFGWMALMGAIWWTYGIGLKGPEPSWQPADPITIVRDPAFLADAGIVDRVPELNGNPTANAQTVSEQLTNEGWIILDEADPGRGQAIAASDAIVQNDAEEFAAGEYVSLNVYDRGGERYPLITESIDFFAFFHKPHYALVEIAPVIPQRVEPGRAPARPVIDSEQPHRYVYMLRDLGAKRQPAIFITIGSTIVFLILCWLLHRRDLVLRAHVSGERLPQRA